MQENYVTHATSRTYSADPSFVPKRLRRVKADAKTGNATSQSTIRKVAGKDVLMDTETFYNPKVLNATLILSKDGHVYARNKKTRKTVALTRIVMNSKKGQLVDHRDRNPLNNRKNNLRIATHRQNMLNRILKSSTGFIGVSINKKKIKGKKIYCAAYYTGKGRRCFYSPFTPRGLMLAAMARDKFILENKDEEYAPLNFSIFKTEPFKSVLLNSDLGEMRKGERYTAAVARLVPKA